MSALAAAVSAVTDRPTRCLAGRWYDTLPDEDAAFVDMWVAQGRPVDTLRKGAAKERYDGSPATFARHFNRDCICTRGAA